jgi:RNA polymerase sigma-70 factor (ECF subfamily)
MAGFVELFRTRDFDAIRAMLADDVKLDLVNRLKWEGRDRIAPYFTRYAEETRWRFAFGAVEGRPAMLVFESSVMETPAYFVLVDWRDNKSLRSATFSLLPMRLSRSIGYDWPLDDGDRARRFGASVSWSRSRPGIHWRSRNRLG